jgi:hypothetical protein
MAQGGFSGRSGAPVDVEHRPSVATHPKSLIGPPQAGLGDALASLRVLPDGTTSRGDARLARAALRPVKPAPIHRGMLWSLCQFAPSALEGSFHRYV